ncbi:DNA-cytosine methyltransferase Dcm2 [methanogenic archaeon ISO4-H5]|nr:DNA-cytosine methyltransferase Dcm2 [methanogenic archaeon ISO4-H5]
MGDIVEFNSDPANIEYLPDFNLLTGGFPCQPFSLMGKKRGFDDDRGTMFFQIVQILRVKKPRYILLENVRNIKLHNNKKTIDVIEDKLKECGYQTVLYDTFNTKNFGLAQTRNRIFIFACKDKLDGFVFDAGLIQKVFDGIKSDTSLMIQNSTYEILDRTFDIKYYLSARVKPTILADGSKSFRSRSEINLMIARPLTATMAKLHRACEDNYYSYDFIYADDPIEYLATKYTKEELAEQKIRRLTPEEAFRLQGFHDYFVENARDAGVSDAQLYRQAGNAISVNTVYAILYYLFVYVGLET